MAGRRPRLAREQGLSARQLRESVSRVRPGRVCVASLPDALHRGSVCDVRGAWPASVANAILAAIQPRPRWHRQYAKHRSRWSRLWRLRHILPRRGPSLTRPGEGIAESAKLDPSPSPSRAVARPRPRGFMGKASPAAEIAELRRQGRALGISIRVNRATKASPVRTYRLIDPPSGKTLFAAVEPRDVEWALWAAAFTRANARPVAQPELCSSCSSPRVATFRWCTSCGGDFEPFKRSGPPIAPSGPSPDDTVRFCQWCGRDQSRASGGADLVRTSEGVYVCPACAERLAVAQGPRRLMSA